MAGLGVEACPYCAALKGLLAQYPGVIVREGPAFEWDLQSPDRGGKFRGGKGVRSHLDHLEMHLNRAGDALYAERQARRAAKAIRLAERTAPGHQAFATKAERRAREDSSKRAKRFAQSEYAREHMGCGKKGGGTKGRRKGQ